MQGEISEALSAGEERFELWRQRSGLILAPAMGATLGASLGFMLPVSTPCNAIVYGSGRIPLTVRCGMASCSTSSASSSS